MKRKKFKGSQNKLFNGTKKKKPQSGISGISGILPPCGILPHSAIHFDHPSKISMKYGKFHYHIGRMCRVFSKPMTNP